MTKQRKASVRRGPSMSQTYPVTCGAAVHSTHGRLGGKLSGASGTYGTQEAGTRTPQVRHGCGTLWLHVYTAGDNAADDVGGDLVRVGARASARARGRVRGRVKVRGRGRGRVKGGEPGLGSGFRVRGRVRVRGLTLARLQSVGRILRLMKSSTRAG